MALNQCTPLDYSAFQSQESTVGMSQQQTVPDQEQQPQEADTFKMEDILEETAKILVSFFGYFIFWRSFTYGTQVLKWGFQNQFQNFDRNEYFKVFNFRDLE